MRLTQAIRRAASVNPDDPATIDGERIRTWREVQDRVARLANGLAGLGVKSGDRVAILAHNCDSFFEAYFGILWAGAVMVPLNTRLAPPELAFQVDDAGADILLFGREFAGMVQQVQAASGRPRTLVGLDEDARGASTTHESLIAGSTPAEDIERRNEDLAGIFYTGGTTGLPKGVMLSHLNLSSMATNLIMACKIDEDCVNLHAAPMFHLADIGIVMVTMVGGTHVFCRHLDDDSILSLAERHRVTHIFTVPAVIDRLAKNPGAATADLSSLKLLGYGGSPMPAGTYQAARTRFPSVGFVQGFGMTEMAAHTFLAPRHHLAGGDPERLKSAGQVCYGFELRVVDADGVEVPRGQIGEIIGRGDNVMMGYWNRTEETRQALRGGWMHSQDVGYMDEAGFIFITDRLKDMIVSGAENVYSIEVESVISRHPAVDECAVIGVPDEKWGERVHAIVVLKAGASLTLDELQAFTRLSIAGYKCPRSLDIHTRSLPRSAAGKVLKTALREPFWSERGRAV